MTLAGDVYGIVGLMINLLKSVYIFPGFSLFTALKYLIAITVLVWILGAFSGVINLRGGGGDD